MTVTDPPSPATAPGGIEIVSITPAPTEAERAAIVAAIETLQSELWPHLSPAAAPGPSPRWRYASRPWQRRQAHGGWR